MVILMMGICVGAFADVSKKNIRNVVDYSADGETFYMVNFTCAEENTVLPNIKNCTFIRSNITNCILDNSNTFEKSNYVPEQPEVIDEETVEELNDRIVQLETFITDNSLLVPIKAVLQ